MYCMDYLEKNIDWLQSKLEPLIKGEYHHSAIVHLGIMGIVILYNVYGLVLSADDNFKH